MLYHGKRTLTGDGAERFTFYKTPFEGQLTFLMIKAHPLAAVPVLSQQHRAEGVFYAKAFVESNTHFVITNNVADSRSGSLIGCAGVCENHICIVELDYILMEEA